MLRNHVCPDPPLIEDFPYWEEDLDFDEEVLILSFVDPRDRWLYDECDISEDVWGRATERIARRRLVGWLARGGSADDDTDYHSVASDGDDYIQGRPDSPLSEHIVYGGHCGVVIEGEDLVVDPPGMGDDDWEGEEEGAFEEDAMLDFDAEEWDEWDLHDALHGEGAFAPDQDAYEDPGYISDED